MLPLELPIPPSDESMNVERPLSYDPPPPKSLLEGDCASKVFIHSSANEFGGRIARSNGRARCRMLPGGFEQMCYLMRLGGVNTRSTRLTFNLNLLKAGNRREPFDFKDGTNTTVSIESLDGLTETQTKG